MKQNSDKKKLVERYLKDPELFDVRGRVSRAAKKGVYQALMDIPSAHIEQMIEQKASITLADKKNYEKMIKGSNSNGFFRPKKSVSGFIFGNRNKNKRGIIALQSHKRGASGLRRTCRHEIGHALDWFNGQNSYASLESQRFQHATDQYLAAKNGSRATEHVFEKDRSFRKEHLPLYKRVNKEYIDPETTYKELAAELYNKYTGLTARYSPQHADQVMSSNYLQAWQAFKEDIVPEINAEIQSKRSYKQGPSTAPRKPSTRETKPSAPKKTTQREAASIAYRRITKSLGSQNILNVGFDPQYNLKIQVPSTFSRRNLEHLGIKNPERVITRENDGDKSILTIPRSHLPLSLKFNGATENKFGSPLLSKIKNFANNLGIGGLTNRKLGA